MNNATNKWFVGGIIIASYILVIKSFNYLLFDFNKGDDQGWMGTEIIKKRVMNDRYILYGR